MAQVAFSQRPLQHADVRRVGSLGAGVELLAEPTYDVDDPALDYLVAAPTAPADEARLSCWSPTLSQRPGGPPVNDKNLRAVTVRSYLAEIRRHLASSAGGLVILRLAEQFADSVACLEPLSEEDAVAPEARHRRPQAETLPRVAAAYRPPWPRMRRASARRRRVSRGRSARIQPWARLEAGLRRPEAGAPRADQSRPSRRSRQQQGERPLAPQVREARE